jgi:CBS domain-containing protein
MRVSEAANTNIVKVKRSLPLRGLLDMFKDFHTTPLIPVVDAQNYLIGVVYPENLLDLLRPAQAKLFRSIPFMEMDEDVFDLEPIPSMGELIIVDDIMDTNFISIKADDSLEEACRIMRLNKKERLPAIDQQGKIVGILGIFDIIWRMFKEKEVV